MRNWLLVIIPDHGVIGWRGLFFLMAVGLIAGLCGWVIQGAGFVLSGKLGAASPTNLTNGYQPYWLPNKSQIAFSNGGKTFVINSDGSGMREAPELSDFMDRRTPGRSRSCLSGKLTAYQLVEFGTIKLYERSGTELGFSPACSPLGDQVVYFRYDEFSRRLEIYAATAVGTNQRLLAAVSYVPSPMWNEASWSTDGEHITFWASSSAGPGIFTLEVR